VWSGKSSIGVPGASEQLGRDEEREGPGGEVASPPEHDVRERQRACDHHASEEQIAERGDVVDVPELGCREVRGKAHREHREHREHAQREGDDAAHEALSGLERAV
jgi:hypothetical protein